MSRHLDIEVRMKEYYENIPKTKLMRRTPVIVRIDGRAFHTFTRKFKEPFDDILIETMQETTKYLCENVQGCVLGYTQSDEITLVLVDYQRFETSAWFDYEIQKICSISASMATMAFNKFFAKNVKEYDMEWKCSLTPQCVEIQKAHSNYMEVLNKAVEKGAMFDARVFNIPKEEVTNCVFWRQLDASRNSVQMCGQYYFSQKQLNKKSKFDIIEMLKEKDFDWGSLPAYKRHGSAVVKKDGTWFIDKEMPELRGTNRDYVEDLI